MKDLPIFLYLDWSSKSLDAGATVDYIERLGFSLESRGDFFQEHGGPLLEAARGIAGCRILDPRSEGSLNWSPTEDDIEREAALLKSRMPQRLKKDLSNLYDGFALARFMKSYIRKGLYIVVTSRMFATFEGSRYHGRTIVMDFPLVLVSTTGVVEAPARPREYYLKQVAYQRALQMGYEVPSESVFQKGLDEEFKGRFIDYDDSRLTDVIRGIILQGIFYLLWSEVFCSSPDCALYNAHTQEELIHAQVSSGRLCNTHSGFLENK